jgi:hypothetical protein
MWKWTGCSWKFLSIVLSHVLIFFQVWYQEDAADGPPGLQCSPINLYTVPV